MQKRFRRVSVLLMLSMLPASLLQATPSAPETLIVQQSGECQGVVKDTNGEAIIGASVVVKGSAQGMITDLDGKFKIADVKPGTVLEISYIGYVKQTITWNGQPLNITLKEDTQQLDEVVVVGFGTQKKANLTGAVTTVKMDEVLGERPLTKASDALQGAVPGLLVSSGGNGPTSSKSFQIRGAYSLGIQNSDGSYGATVAPLILIDNVEGDIDLVNPDDIESITVLKDAASSAIYGARAAGGVILVTTKRPQGATRFQLNYNNNLAFTNAINLPKQASLDTYLQAYQDTGRDDYWSLGSPSVTRWRELLQQYQQDPSSVPTQGDGIFRDDNGALYYLNEKDLIKNMLETGFQQTHNLSVSGGTERLRFRLSGGFTNNDGVLIGDKDTYRRLNVNSFISADITPWFTQEATLSYAHSKSTNPESAAGGIYSLRLGSYYPEGNMPAGYGVGGDDDLPFFTPKNQVLNASPSRNNYDNPRIFLKSILKPLKGLEVAFEYTFDKNMYDYHYYTSSVTFTTIQGGANTSPTNDYLRKYKQFTNYNAINAYATYNFDLGTDHHFKVMAGFLQPGRHRGTFAGRRHGPVDVQ